jgi:nucleoid-associated protein YgaU
MALGLIFSATAWATDQPQSVRLPIALSYRQQDAVIVEVIKGDSLWKISERRLDEVIGREAMADEISPYWRVVIETNREGLRSGDPDLIYPGETVVLPPVNESR